ncbi:uncharacterized protein LOC141708463 [Apium graveolens]|uniref:uncharacterized protein LOC141708463 n=1 Tax=Apium graveolens TaxID=4045 RepID=UPI003D7BA8D4
MKRPQKPAEDPPMFVPWQPNCFEFRHPPSDLFTCKNGNSALDISLGRSLELRQTLVRASQQVNILEHGQPRELLQTPTCAYQQGNYLANRRLPSDLVTFLNDTPALNIPYGRSQLLQTPTCASQQANILERVLPCELFQTLIRASQRGNISEHVLPHEIHQTPSLVHDSLQRNILVHGQPRELLQAPICANQQRNYLASRHHPSDLNLHMWVIPGCNEPPHIDHILLKCKNIFGGFFEQVVKALGGPNHNSSYFLKEALQLGYTRYIDGDPRGTLTNYALIIEELGKIVAWRQAWQVSRQLTVENNLASNSRTGPFS